MHQLVTVLTTILPSYVCLAIGVYTLGLHTKPVEQRVFFVYNLLLAFLCYVDYEYRLADSFEQAKMWSRAQFLWPFVVVLPFHFSYLLCRKYIRLFHGWFLLLYLSAFTVSVLHFSPGIYQSFPRFGIYGWQQVYINSYVTLGILVWIVAVGLLASAMPLLAWKRETKYLIQRQYKYLFFAFAVGYFFGALTGYLIPALGGDYPELGKLSLMVSNVFIVLAIWKFGMFEYTAKSVAESVLQTMPAAVFVTNVRGIVELVNNAGVNYLRRNETDIIGKDIGTFFTGTDSHESDTDDYLKSLDGKPVPVYKTSDVIYDSRGVFQGMLVIATDISAVKRAELNLLLAKDKAEESDRLKSVFLANISHEIRTPMNAILGFAQLIGVSSSVEDKQKKYLGLISKNVNNLLHIIDDLIEISKLESSKTQVNRDAFPVTELFDQLEVFFENIAASNEKNDVSLIFRNVDPKTEKIITDRGIVFKILGKLIENSLKFTEDGTVEVGFYSMEDTLAIFYVKDTGIGIPKEKCKVIFEPFRQSEDSYARKFGGTGVSLTIAKRYVELLGGKIWVESENEKGAIFYFSVPIWGK